MKSLARFLASTALLAALPLAAPAEDLASYTAPQLFQRFCASCHGREGQGDGPVAPFFKLTPPDLTGLSRRSGGNFPAERVRRIVDGREVVTPHGARQMPVWDWNWPWPPVIRRRAGSRLKRVLPFSLIT